MEDNSQQVDTGILDWMKCVTVNIIWKILHSMWTLLLKLDELHYSEQYMEDTSQQVDTCIVAWMKGVKEKNKWKILHSRWTLLLLPEWSALQWTLYGSFSHFCTLVLHLTWIAPQFTLYGRYFKADGNCYFRLNEVLYNEHYIEDLHVIVHWYYSWNKLRFSEHYTENTSQHLDNRIATWVKCVTMNVVLKILHSRLTLILQLEWSRYSEYYMEDISQQVDNGITDWMNSVKLIIILKIFHSRWTLVFQIEWSALQ